MWTPSFFHILATISLSWSTTNLPPLSPFRHGQLLDDSFIISHLLHSKSCHHCSWGWLNQCPNFIWPWCPQLQNPPLPPQQLTPMAVPQLLSLCTTNIFSSNIPIIWSQHFILLCSWTAQVFLLHCDLQLLNSSSFFWIHQPLRGFSYFPTKSTPHGKIVNCTLKQPIHDLSAQFSKTQNPRLIKVSTLPALTCRLWCCWRKITLQYRWGHCRSTVPSRSWAQPWWHLHSTPLPFSWALQLPSLPSPQWTWLLLHRENWGYQTCTSSILHPFT